MLTRPDEFDVIATPNLNGDYLSDALAAQVGGIGIAPGGNINYVTGHAIFEATHGTAPKYADQDKVNPGSVILSGEMMLRHMGWNEAADLIVKGMDGAIAAKQVTYDFARLMAGATELKTSEFADAIIAACSTVRAELQARPRGRLSRTLSLESDGQEMHESQSDRGGWGRQRRGHGGPLHRRQGTRRRRHRRHRRSEGGRRRARHARVVSDHRIRQPHHRRLRLLADRRTPTSSSSRRACRASRA